MKKLGWMLVVFFCVTSAAWCAQPAKPAARKSGATAVRAPAAPGTGRQAISLRSADPYLGAIVIDPVSSTILFEDKADEPGYPASVVKLMGLLLIEERLDAGLLSLSNTVQVTAEAAGIGGSQAYLAEKEIFSVEDLLAAMVIHSANDAAAALALHVAGSRNAFVDLMNKRAAELGMNATRFHSVHGLPPAAGQEPDISTARDLALLAREVMRHPDVLRYTAVKFRPFRNGAFTLRNPDHLIGNYPGYDGLKTGYFRAGGFSIVSTAQRNGRRVIAVVLGSRDSKVRDATAKDLLSRGFLTLEKIPPPPPPVVVSTNIAPTNAVAAEGVDMPVKPVGRRHVSRLLLGAGIAVVVLVIGVVLWRMSRPRS
jgi:D-alanyl-D-alanine carboxypeptidase (penicillin-binding protein 5/6)